MLRSRKLGLRSPDFGVPLRPAFRLSTALLVSACFGLAASPVDRLQFQATETTLTNGLRVITLEDHSHPLVAVQVWYRVGSADEPPGRHGFAHLFEHMMFRGTDRLGPTDHFDLLRGVGGNCNAFTSFDETCYHETLPAQQLQLALWLEAERMAFLTVDATGFTTERKVVEEERRLALSMPYGELADKGPPLVFGDHPYGHDPLGTFLDLRQSTPADVHAWWTRHYTPNNATLVIVGDVQPNQVRALCERYFGWIPSIPKSPRDLPVLRAWESQQQITLNLANAPAPAVGLVWRTVPEGHPDALALDLLATILGSDPFTAIRGGGNSSRLYRRLVAEDKLAVIASAMEFGLSRGGLFGVGAALSPFGGDTTRTLTALGTEMEHLRADGVTEVELEKARNQAITALVREAQTVEGKASLLGRAAVVGTGITELNSRFDRLNRVTRGDLQRVATTYLAPEKAMAVTVPGSSLWQQLGRLFFGRNKTEEAAPVAFAQGTLLRGREGVVRPPELPLRPPLSDLNSPVPNPTIQEHHLTNGLRVLVLPASNPLVVHAVLALPYGSWAEPTPGVATMALNMLAKGTEAHDEKALAEELDRYGITISGSATADDSQIQVTCLLEHTERAFALMAEIVTQPTFPAAPLRIAVTQATTELRLEDTTPYLVADREFQRHLFPSHPYGRRVSGEIADLLALKPEPLAALWRRIARPDQATLIIAGALADKQAVALAERALSNWRGATSPEPIPPSPAPPSKPPPPGPTRILIVDWPGASQSQIRIGGLGIVNRDPDKPVANLMGSYFGGAFGSRLMKVIRVQQGATYGASGGFEANRFAGSLVVRTFTKTGSTATTVRAAIAELRGLIERPPTSEELSLHKRYFLGSAAARFETPEQVAAQLAYFTLNGLPLDYLQQSLDKLGAANSAQCVALAERVVQPDHLLVVVVGDASLISKDLAAIAPVTVLDRDGQPIKTPSTP